MQQWVLKPLLRDCCVGALLAEGTGAMRCFRLHTSVSSAMGGCARAVPVRQHVDLSYGCVQAVHPECGVQV